MAEPADQIVCRRLGNGGAHYLTTVDIGPMSAARNGYWWTRQREFAVKLPKHEAAAWLLTLSGYNVRWTFWSEDADG